MILNLVDTSRRVTWYVSCQIGPYVKWHFNHFTLQSMIQCVLVSEVRSAWSAYLTYGPISIDCSQTVYRLCEQTCFVSSKNLTNVCIPCSVSVTLSWRCIIDGGWIHHSFIYLFICWSNKMAALLLATIFLLWAPSKVILVASCYFLPLEVLFIHYYIGRPS